MINIITIMIIIQLINIIMFINWIIILESLIRQASQREHGLETFTKISRANRVRACLNGDGPGTRRCSWVWQRRRRAPASSRTARRSWRSRENTDTSEVVVWWRKCASDWVRGADQSRAEQSRAEQSRGPIDETKPNAWRNNALLLGEERDRETLAARKFE